MKLVQAVEATAPTRIDLAGGTVDLWPLYLFHPGSVTVNAAIDLHVRVQVTPKKGSRIVLVDEREDKTVFWGRVGGAPVHPRYELFRQVLEHFSVTQGLELRFHSEAPRGAGLALVCYL